MMSVVVDDELEREAAAVLSRCGMTTETAVQALFRHLAEHGTLPVALRLPRVVAGAINARGDDREHTPEI